MNDIHKIIEKRFNNTNKLIFLATSHDNVPYVRAMTPYYNQGAFYFISHIHSSKIAQIHSNHLVALCGEWFNAQGIAYVYPFQSLDSHLKGKIKEYTKSWIALGNVDLNNADTCVIKVELTQGYIYENNIRYDIKQK